MTRLHQALLAAAVVLLPTAVLASEITAIEVIENTKTDNATVALIADIDVGDDYGPELLNEVRVRLVTSQLFKRVDVFATPFKGGQKVTIVAEDKHSWIVAPTFYNQPGNVGGGIGFAEANLFGQNKKLLLYGQYATADSFFLAGYVDPAIRGTRFSWQVYTFLRQEDVTEFRDPGSFTEFPEGVRESRLNYYNGGLKVGINILRSLRLEQTLRGAWVSYGDVRLFEGIECGDVVDPDAPDAAQRLEDCQSGEGLEPGAEGWDVTTVTALTYDNKANWYGIQTGTSLKLSYETSLADLGSEFDYWIASAKLFRGWRGLLLGDDNLTFDLGVNVGEDVPFQQEFTKGGVNLRGYRNRQFRGDFSASSKVEFSVPMFTVMNLSFRALAFYDQTYIDFRDRDSATDDFRNYLPNRGSAIDRWRHGVGGGIRLYFRSVVVPLLGFDVGYGLGHDEIITYFAIGLTEL